MSAFTKKAIEPILSSEIVVSFRDIQGKRMHGAFFDHYLLTRITQHSTVIAKSDRQNTTRFEEFIRGATLALGVGSALGERLIPLLSTHNPEKAGLLFIPGRMREEAGLAERDCHEKSLIRIALNRGQPILGICGGSWPLYEALGGTVKAVADHTYSSMPYIVSSGHVGNNVLMHDIVCQGNSLLKRVMPSTDQMVVNSVHWLAPDQSTLPVNTMISALSKQNDSIAPSSRQGNQLKPEENCVEGFETVHGAPVIGVSWHPEAFYQKGMNTKNCPHLSLLLYMAQAGDTYAAKRRILKELQEKTI